MLQVIFKFKYKLWETLIGWPNTTFRPGKGGSLLVLP